jgi:phosphatidylglycerophosphate synthase
MPRRSPALVIDARPRGPTGPLAGELVLGRPVLAHLVELASALERGPIPIHARADEHAWFHSLVDPGSEARIRFTTGPPPEGAAVLRTDRLYDPGQLGRALRRGRDPESAVVWRLDRPFALEGASDELIRRRTYQPLGRFWALAPARLLARALKNTPVRPNALTLASAALVLGSAAAVAFAGSAGWIRAATATGLAVALVLDTADGHLARLQGTASEFGRWLDGYLDELGDVALHAGVAWAAFVRDGRPAWLVLGMAYGMGKFLFFVGNATWSPGTAVESAGIAGPGQSGPSRLVHWAGHADVRWHLWIILAALGRLDVALAAYAAYFPARALAGVWRKARCHAA